VNSVDYLLKPIDPEHLERALTKVENLRRAHASAPVDVAALLAKLEESLAKEKQDYPERIASRMGTRLCFLDLPKVTHFFAEDKLTLASSEGQSFCVDHSIAVLEKKLDPKKFLRIHRATIVNIAWIKEVAPLPGGGLNLRLRDARKTDLTVARDRAAAFKSRAGL
jgi:two-component system LytT family response regulator